MLATSTDREGKWSGRKISVLVADSTCFHTQLLAGVLQNNPGLDVATSELDPRAITSASVTQKIDVFVLSAFADGNELLGFEVLQQVKEANPSMRAVLLLDSSNSESVLKAFRAGARGVLDHRDASNMLYQCIRRVHEGQVWINNVQLGLVLDALASAPKVRAVGSKGLSLLSKRESDVVRCVAEGLGNREIAQHLRLSQHTIKNHLFRIFDKLGVSNRIELLFMTLSPGVAAASSLTRDLLQDPSGDYDQATLDFCEKAAEQGVLAAQLMLARLSWRERGDERNLIRAYRWFSIAIDELLGIKNTVKKAMTPAQLNDAERQIKERINRSQRLQQAVDRKPLPEQRKGAA
jgi:DNA-binding NarL/FixJ family response regulator